MTGAILSLPVPLRALGDEVRILQKYFARGWITQEDADERFADWDISYPPGFWDIEMLVDERQCLAVAPQLAEAAE
jgi:hypothetical protein